jgi:hypothetical protein
MMKHCSTQDFVKEGRKKKERKRKHPIIPAYLKDNFSLSQKVVV